MPLSYVYTSLWPVFILKRGKQKIPHRSRGLPIRTDVYYSIVLIFHGPEKMTESKQLLK